MRIDPSLAAAAVATSSAKTASRSAVRFEPAGREAVGRSVPRRGAAPVASLATIIMLQGEDEPAERRRRGARRGRELLDALDGLKAGLLAGRMPASALDRLAAGVADLPPTGDPGLDELLAAIALRARVELAKLGRA